MSSSQSPRPLSTVDILPDPGTPRVSRPQLPQTPKDTTDYVNPYFPSYSNLDHGSSGSRPAPEGTGAPRLTFHVTVWTFLSARCSGAS